MPHFLPTAALLRKERDERGNVVAILLILFAIDLQEFLFLFAGNQGIEQGIRRREEQRIERVENKSTGYIEDVGTEVLRMASTGRPRDDGSHTAEFAVATCGVLNRRSL